MYVEIKEVDYENKAITVAWIEEAAAKALEPYNHWPEEIISVREFKKRKKILNKRKYAARYKRRGEKMK